MDKDLSTNAIHKKISFNTSRHDSQAYRELFTGLSHFCLVLTPTLTLKRFVQYVRSKDPVSRLEESSKLDSGLEASLGC